MAHSSCLNRCLKPNKLLLRRIDGAIQVRSHVDLTFYSLMGSGRSNFLFTRGIRAVPGGGAPRLLSSRESIHPLSVYGELSLEHRLRLVLNGKMEHLTTHLHRPRTTRSPLSFSGDGGIVPFEPFFMLFPAVWRKQQSIGLSNPPFLSGRT
ncbi:hypothetical protein VPH35_101012 [Triticum aestivum]